MLAARRILTWAAAPRPGVVVTVNFVLSALPCLYNWHLKSHLRSIQMFISSLFTATRHSLGVHSECRLGDPGRCSVNHRQTDIQTLVLIKWYLRLGVAAADRLAHIVAAGGVYSWTHVPPCCLVRWWGCLGWDQKKAGLSSQLCFFSPLPFQVTIASSNYLKSRNLSQQ